MIFARELFEATNPGSAEALGIGPTFEELLEFASAYVDLKVTAVGASEPRDIGIYYWSQRALGILETAIRGAQVGTASVPILGDPPFLDTANYKRSQWTGIVADGRKTPTTGVPCHTDLERHFVKFLDGAKDVLRYFKNERFGFSVTYYENNRPRQYYPDFIVVAHDASKHEVTWLVETKGEIRANTAIKRSAAELLCEKMSTTQYGAWRHLFVQQRPFEQALASGGVKSFGALGHALVRTLPSRQLRLIAQDDPRVLVERFKALLPLYSLKVAAGYFGSGQAVEPEGWVDASSVGKLDDTMFVAQAVGRSMEPTIFDGEYCVFRANPVGSREGKIVLVQHYGPADPETGGSYTVKKYHSEKVSAEEGDWQHLRITLQPESPEFEPIVLTPEAEHDVRVIAEFVAALGRS
jgi:SOS-response transcriptional repressor LexA